MRIEPTLTPRSVRRRARALIADDDPSMRALLTDLLHLDGYHVTDAADGDELLFLVVKAFGSGGGGVDLIVSDLELPCCDGLEVLQRLREAQRTTPVVLLSTDVDSSLRARVEGLRGRFLAKPFTFDALRCTIRDARRQATGE